MQDASQMARQGPDESKGAIPCIRCGEVRCTAHFWSQGKGKGYRRSMRGLYPAQGALRAFGVLRKCWGLARC
eukprot:2652684-Pleurochrysis_carterae.AAC.2